ncbi:Beta-lactamase class C [Patulibacter medicamentivorans]|jgi:CubicO group peptidase (beta-lactamase class C family)|uniref:Beta-lactamase class C n=1 Tax=Patulibacter medicamentivorans TaxID=1097667 RepID=H0E883_9ACTN|nr:serine hydrolase domain-containing protein [Patulibacter medicamentivorans]EHN10148.1 Beta-lactamase class C [Patulibacter medicamentivorans]
MTSGSPSFDLVHDLLAEHVRERRLPCAVFGVATSSGIQSLEAFGSAAGRAVERDDTFLLFSAGKPLVGLTAMRQVERGRLSLRTPLSEAVPMFGLAREDEVTLWHLLTHTGGIVEATVAPETSLLDQLLYAPQMYEAGRFALYSNVGFTGIGEMIGAAAGRPLHELLPDDLGALPGVDGLSLDPDVPCIPLEGLDRVVIDVDRFRALRHPAGAVSATAGDLLALSTMLLAGDRQLIHPGTLQAMTRPQTTGIERLMPDPLHIGPGTGQEWGLVWNMRTSPTIFDHRLYGHGGLSGCQWWMYPEHDAAFVLLTNVMNPLDVGVDLDGVHNAFTTCLDPIDDPSVAAYPIGAGA